MGAKSGIEWTDATWNPVRARVWEIQSDGSGKERIGWHCEHVSEGCRNCYAEAINLRLGTGRNFKPGELFREEKKGFHNGEVKLFLDEKLLTDPLRWKKPRSVFLSSMTDVFADFVTDEMLDRLFAVMALSPQHFYRVLTKRPERMRAYIENLGVHAQRDRANDLPARWQMRLYEANPAATLPITKADVGRRLGVYPKFTYDMPTPCWPLPNVGLGVSVEDQASADERIPPLLATPAAMRFVSAEPLLGPVILEEAWHGESALEAECWGECGWCDKGLPPLHNCRRFDSMYVDRSGLDEVIVGGESGAHARAMHPDWARSLRDQCARDDVAFFFKQWGGWAPNLFSGANIVRVEGDQGGWVAAWPDGTIGNGCADEKGGNAIALMSGRKGQFLPLLDGREHREIAPQVKGHFEKLAPHPKNPETDFSTSPQGGGEGIAEGEAG